jgi:hypothetical protein
MKCFHVLRGPGDLRLMVSTPLLNSSLCPLGDTSLRAINPPLPLHGDLGHLRLLTKHDEHLPCIIEYVGNSRTQLAGLTTGTLYEGAKAHPQQ